MSENAPTPALSARPNRRRRTFLWGRLSIRSKLLVMLLVVSILSILAASYFAYRSSSRALTAQATEQLTSIRDARTRQIQSTFVGLQRSSVLNSSNLTATEAMSAFTRDFAELQGRATAAADQSALDGYYTDVFLPELRKNTNGEVTARSFEPTTNAARYLQSRYTVPAKGDFDQAITVGDAGDGSAWSADHAKYHPFFRQVVEANGFDDALLVDPDGNVVYSAYKGVDLGTNLLTGPYKDSGLETAFRGVLRSNTVNDISIVDFEPYAPSYDVPIGFALSPIGVDGKLTGVLVVQLPSTAINNVMTSNGQWAQTGLGQSGESYLVGPDGTLRSTSRLLEENPEAYRAAVVDQGTPPLVADRIVADKNPILRQDVDTLGGPGGAARPDRHGSVETDYLGRRVLTAYAPVAINGINWAVMSQIDEDEALRPGERPAAHARADHAGHRPGHHAGVPAARPGVHPAGRPAGERGAQGGGRRPRGAGGRAGGRTSSPTSATAFNDMGSSLSTKQELLDAEMAENDRLLGDPDAGRRGRAVPHRRDEHRRGAHRRLGALRDDRQPRRARPGRRTRLGGCQPAERARRELRPGGGTDRGGEGPGAALGLHRQLRAGRPARRPRPALGRLRPERCGTPSSCSAPSRGCQLGLRVGIDSGSVTSGLVGGAAIYDLWGDSVNLAFRAQAANREPGIYLTEAVHQRVRDAHTFSPAGDVSTKTGTEAVWRLEVGARV